MHHYSIIQLDQIDEALVPLPEQMLTRTTFQASEERLNSVETQDKEGQGWFSAVLGPCTTSSSRVPGD